MPDLTRRNFLKASAMAGAAITLGPIAARPSGGAGDPGAPAPSPSWTDRPMRWAQLTLVENDPGSFDPKFWLDYFARTHSDAVCLSAGGCVAYYPTNLPFHHRSAWLGDQDVFGDLVAGCRRLGMVVVARTDPHATYDDAQAAHPDWIAVGADGRPRRHWASPEMWVTCGLGPYNFEFMTGVKKEIMTRYRVDGIFINRWDGAGLCYCEHCRENFKAASGLALPRSESPTDPAHRAYLLWRQERLFSLWRLWDGALREINPDSCLIPNTGGGASSSLDMRRIGELAPTLMADRQSRRGLMAPWANGKNAKEYRATMGAKPVVGIFSVGLDEVYRWKDAVQAPAEIRLWVADGIANGMRPWFTKFGGVINDPRWLKPVEDIYRWCHGAESYLRNERPLARVAVVYSQQTSWFAAGERGAPGGVEDASLGWHQALMEARIPFEMVHDRLLDPEHLAPFLDAHPAQYARRSPRPNANSSAGSWPGGADWWRPRKRRSTMNGGPRARTSGSPTFLARRGWAGARDRCTMPTFAWSTTARAATRFSSASRRRPGSFTASGGWTLSPAPRFPSCRSP